MQKFFSSEGFVQYDQPRLRKQILGGLIGILAIVYLGFEYFHDGDFFIYYTASVDFFLGKNIYKEYYGTCKCFPFYGSPTLAYLLGIFSFIPFFFSAFLWKGLSLIFLYRTWILIEMYFDVSVFNKRDYIKFVVLSFLSIAFVLYRNFHLGQFTIFLLYVIFEGIHQIRSGKAILGSAIIALGIVCKVMPIVAIPYLVYRNYWKSAILVIGFSILLLFLPAIFLGFDQSVFLLKEWQSSINPANDMNIFDVSTNDIHGIPALLSTLFISGLEDENTLHIPRHLVNLEREHVKIIIQTARLMLLLGTFYFLRSCPFRDEKRPLYQIWEFGFILLITPLVFPQQRLYAFYFLFPAISFLVYYFILESKKAGRQNRKTLLYLTVFALIIFNLELIVGNFREYYWHYKTVTYSVLILMLILAIVRPSKIEQILNPK